MKKISIILAACVAALGFFSSCGEDDDSMSLSVTVMDQATGKVAMEANLIKTAVLKVVDGETKTDVSATYKTELNQLITKGNVIFNLPAATYELTVTDKDVKEIVKKFTIGGGDVEIDWSTATNKISAEGTYAYKQGDKVGTIVVSNLTAASMTVKLDAFTAVTLSDADASWLMNDGSAKKQADATTEENTPNIVCAKKDKAAEIVSWELTKAGELAPNAVKFIKFIAE